MDLTAAQPRSYDAGRPRGRGLAGPRLRPAPRHLRVARWQGDPYTALVGPARTRRSPTVREIERCMRQLEKRGVGQAVTPALNPVEAEVFFQAGFVLHERLHLLARTLNTDVLGRDPESIKVGDTPSHRAMGEGIELVRAKRHHRRTMLAIDARAFQGFWRFDDMSLREAMGATPHTRARLAKIDGRAVGYAVTGRTETRGYLQRLAVDPHYEGRGIGSTLVEDSAEWLRRYRVNTSLVNTQETNQRALDLYQRLGFVQQHEGLMVLRWNRGP